MDVLDRGLHGQQHSPLGWASYRELLRTVCTLGVRMWWNESMNK